MVGADLGRCFWMSFVVRACQYVKWPRWMALIRVPVFGLKTVPCRKAYKSVCVVKYCKAPSVMWLK